MSQNLLDFSEIFSDVKHSTGSEGDILGNKAKWRISKQVLQENKACQIFRKKNMSYPLILIRPCAFQGVRTIRFSEHLPCFVFL